MAVTAPAGVAGHVTINSTAVVSHTDPAGSVICAIVEATGIPTGLNPIDVPSTQWAQPTGTPSLASVSGTRTFTITAGDTTTYVLACEEFNADGDVIFARNLTAIFTPAA